MKIQSPYFIVLAGLLIMAFSLFSKELKDSVQGKGPLSFEMETIDGERVPLDSYASQVVLLVNVASKCGLTPQYEGLQKLYETYKDQEFVVLGFPANNFMGQEPGTDAEIKQFCSTNYGVTFPIFSKISVKGKDQHPLYQYLTDKQAHDFGGAIKWNFTKFLIGKDGQIKARFSPNTKPNDAKVISAIENELS